MALFAWVERLTPESHAQAGSIPMVVGWPASTGRLNPIPADIVDIKAVSAGGTHSAALTAQGAVKVWGVNWAGQTDVPAAARSGVKAIAAGGQHTLALKEDGSVVAWGWNDIGQATVPPAARSGVTAIAAGSKHSLALKADGSVVAWGHNESGQTNVPPAALSGVTSIAAGAYAWHSIALKSDGSVVAWGGNSANLLRTIGLTNLRAAAVGYDQTVLLTGEGSVRAWEGSHGWEIPTPAGAQSNVTAISAGMSHILALRSDGSVISWGTGTTNRPLGEPGSENFVGELTVPEAARRGVVAISAGYYDSLALLAPVIAAPPAAQTVELGARARFAVETTGAGARYRWFKDGDPIPGATNVVYDFMVTQTSQAGSYWVVAGNAAGSVTSAPPAVLTVTLLPPVILSGPTNLTVNLLEPAGLTVNATGSLLNYQWRKNGVSLAGETNRSLHFAATRLADAGEYTVAVGNVLGAVIHSLPAILTVRAFPPEILVQPSGRTVGEGEPVSLFAQVTGSQLSYQWFKDGMPIPGAATATFNLGPAHPGHAGQYRLVVSNFLGVATSAPPAVVTVIARSPSESRGGAVLLWSYGDATPLRVPPAARGGVIAIATGGNYPGIHTLAVKADGTVVAWGANDYGQTDVPAGLSNAVAVAAGGSHSVALKSDGTLVAWGSNNYGETEIPPAARNGVVAIAAGGQAGGPGYTLALKADGAVIGWGYDEYGAAYVPEPALSGVVAVSASASAYPAHVLALKSDGSVVAWGSNEQGESEPPEAARTGVVAVAAGSYHSLALKSDGSVIAWGALQAGVPEAAARGVIAIAAGYNHSLALKADGTVVVWGGAAAPLGGIAAIAAGAFHSAAIVTPTAPAILAQPVSREANAGEHASFSVRATGYPLSFQWSHNGVAVPEATGSTYNLGAVKPEAAGEYSVVVSNPMGTSASLVATLTVHPAATPSGSAVDWGLDSIGQFEVPPGAREGVIAVAAGEMHSLALKDDGGVLAWGDNGSGQTDVPELARGNVTAIAAGMNHSLALTADGAVLAWGNNDYGQTNVPESARSGVVAIAAFAYGNLALKADGSIVNWPGNGSWGYPQGQEGVTAIAAIAAMGEGLFLKEDGSAVHWLRRGGGMDEFRAPYIAVTNGAVAVAAGLRHGLILKEDGSLVQVNNNSWTETPASATNGVKRILAGGNYSMAFKTDGSVVGWGADDFLGRTGSDFAGTNLLAIAGGAYHTLLLGIPGAPRIAAEPGNQSAEVGQSATFTVRAEGFPLNYQWRKNGSPIPGAIFSSHSFTVTQNHLRPAEQAALYTVTITNRLGSVTNLGARFTATAFAPVIAKHPASQRAPLGQAVTLSVEATGTQLQYQWRRNGTNLPGANGSAFRLAFPEMGDAGEYTVLVSNFLGSSITPSPATVTVDPPVPGSVVAFGRNVFGETAVPAAALGGVSAIAAGNYHVAALKRDGSVLAWGNGDFINVPASARSGVTAIAVGERHTLALKSNGSVVAWGANDLGQLDVPAAAQEGVVQIAAGAAYSVALKRDGSVLFWGQIFDGSRYLPASVPGGELTGIQAIAAHWQHGLALRNDGTVVAWGYVRDGTNSVVVKAVPPYVPPGLRDVTAIAAGDHHSAALRSDGSVVAWGFIGVRGNPAYVPVQALSGVVAIEAGPLHIVAYKVDGTAVSWGNDLLPTPTALLRRLSSLQGGWWSYEGGGYLVALLNAVPFPPAMAIQSEGEDVILDWDAAAAGYSLQWTRDLSDPNSWRTVLTPIQAGQTLVDSAFGPAKFYRLFRP